MNRLPFICYLVTLWVNPPALYNLLPSWLETILDYAAAVVLVLLALGTVLCVLIFIIWQIKKVRDDLFGP